METRFSGMNSFCSKFYLKLEKGCLYGCILTLFTLPCLLSIKKET